MPISDSAAAMSSAGKAILRRGDLRTMRAPSPRREKILKMRAMRGSCRRFVRGHVRFLALENFMCFSKQD